MIFIEVHCDKCGSVGLSRRCFYAHQMREELKKAGWKHVAEGGKELRIKDIERLELAALPLFPTEEKKPKTGRELLQALKATGLVGVWKDRTDIGDSSTFARKLRKKAQTRTKDFCPKCKPRRKPRRRSRTTITLVNSERKTGRG